MQDAQLKEILSKYRRIHVLGISPSPERDSHKVAKYLVEHGYEVFGIRPGGGSILERPCYESMAESAHPVEILDVFRAAEHVPAIVEDAIKAGVKVLWLQEGVSHPEAERKAAQAGIQVVSNLCIKKEHRRLIGD